MGGDNSYTWQIPTIVEDAPGSSCAANAGGYNGSCTFAVMEINNPSMLPVGGVFTVAVRDGQGQMQQVDFEVLPPPPVVEDLYVVGNAGISPGATEEIFVRVNNYGGMEDVKSIEVQLRAANGTIFSVIQYDPTIEVVSEPAEVVSGSGETTTSVPTNYTVLYTIPVLIPDYYDLVDGDYSFVITVFDAYNQETETILSTYIGEVASCDLNHDQSIDILDIVKVVMFYLNPNLKPTARELQAADTNGNQKIDLIDVVKIIQEAMKE